VAQQDSQSIEVNAQPDDILAVITDYESYPDWIGNMKDVEVRETDEEGRGSRVWYHLDAKVMDIEYVLAYEYPDERTVSWDLVEGEQLRQLDGRYDLEPLGNGTTKVTYSLAADVAIPLPGFMKKRAAKTIMETGLEDLKRRVEGG
jgi:ribosome-associated toxin RatA of RatAB toxin-antitoxin module